MFKIIDNLAKLPKDVEKWDKNRRFAVAVGITWTAGDVKNHIRKTMATVFDKPTRWTLNSMGMKPAKRDDYDAKVFFKDFAPKGRPAGKYLGAEIEGGDRALKRSEWHFRNRGYLPQGMYLVPGDDAKLNAYGNIPASTMTKALSDCGAQFDSKQNTTKSKKKYFWLPRAGRRLAGIYFRQGGRLKTLMVAVRKPAYRKRLDFYGEARKVTDTRLTKNVDKALERYIKV